MSKDIGLLLALVGVARRFGRHHDGCACLGVTAKECTCGWGEALTLLGQLEEQLGRDALNLNNLNNQPR